MKNIFRLAAALTLSVALGACTGASPPSGQTDASVMGVNYTTDYIDFTLMSPSGASLGTGGSADPFPKGGAGGNVCCAMVPSVGRTVRVDFRVGGFNDAADQYKTYRRDVVVTGTMPSPKFELQSFLIVRFFPNHVVEAELIPGDDARGMKNPRVDQLLLGRRVMRQPGD